MSLAPALRSLRLEGQYVSLEPLLAGHAPLLFLAAGPDAEEIFRSIPYPMRTLDDFQKWVTTAFAEQERGESALFAMREKSTGEFIGSTRFMNISLPNRRVEIGST